MSTQSSLAQVAVTLGFVEGHQGTLEFPHPRARIQLSVTHGEMTFEAEFRQAFSFEMQVRDLRDPDYLDFWTQPEHTFDEPDFDEAVLVRGAPYGIRSLLTPRVRRELLDLRNVATGFTLTGRELRAVCLAPDSASAGRAVERFLSTVNELTGPSKSRGAYR